MRQTYRNRMAMMATTQKYLQDNEAVWKANKPFANNVAALKEIMAVANAAAEGQTAKSTGITQDKYALEAKALDALSYIAKSTKAYALDVDNNELRAAASYNRSQLDKLNEGEQLSRMRNILSHAQAVAAELKDYGVDGDRLSSAAKALDLYEQALPNPRSTIAERTVQTDSLDGIMKQSRRILERLDTLVHIFDEVKAQFVAGYKAARLVVDAGTRHDKPAV